MRIGRDVVLAHAGVLRGFDTLRTDWRGPGSDISGRRPAFLVADFCTVGCHATGPPVSDRLFVFRLSGMHSAGNLYYVYDGYGLPGVCRSGRPDRDPQHVVRPGIYAGRRPATGRIVDVGASLFLVRQYYHRNDVPLVRDRRKAASGGGCRGQALFIEGINTSAMNPLDESEYVELENEAGTLPGPTAAPPAMAMGIMMLAWGIVTHWTMSVGGLVLMGVALWLWINEIRNGWSPS